MGEHLSANTQRSYPWWLSCCTLLPGLATAELCQSGFQPREPVTHLLLCHIFTRLPQGSLTGHLYYYCYYVALAQFRFSGSVTSVFVILRLKYASNRLPVTLWRSYVTIHTGWDYLVVQSYQSSHMTPFLIATAGLTAAIMSSVFTRAYSARTSAA